MKFADLKAKTEALKKEHEEKIDALEAEMWADMGIKPEDLYPPEERAARFNALLEIMCHTPPETHKAMVERSRKKRNE